MAKMFGTVAYDEYGGHTYACLQHSPDEPGPGVEPLTMSDLREEAYWCDFCEDLILPSEGNWYDESTAEDRDEFIASGREYELDG